VISEWWKGERRIKIQTVASATSSNGEEGGEGNEEWEGENIERRTSNGERPIKIQTEGNEGNEGRIESNTRTFVLFVIFCSTNGLRG